MGELLIVSGPPGAGKSTVCDLLAERFSSSVLISGDWFFGLWRRGAIAPWLPEALPQVTIAGDAAARTAGTFAGADCQVIYDGVIRPRELPRFGAATGLAGVHYAVLLPPLATCLARVAARTGHGFTSAGAARAMHGDFATATLPARHLITGARHPPGEVAGQVLDRMTAGMLRWTTSWE